MKRNWFTSGDWNAICDVCGFKRKGTEVVERWDGLMVCAPTVKKGCYELRHPQELIRPIPDQQKLPWTRPEATDNFITGFCTGISRQAIPGLGQPGCMIPGLDLGLRNSLNPTT